MNSKLEGKNHTNRSFIRKENLLKNNFLIGFIYDTYFKRSLSTCHQLPSPRAKGTDRRHVKMTTPTDTTVVPVKVKVMGGKRDLKHMLIKIANNDIKLSLKNFNFTCTYHLEQLRDLFLRI